MHTPADFRVRECYFKGDELWTAIDLKNKIISVLVPFDFPADKRLLCTLLLGENINTLDAYSRKNKLTKFVKFLAMAWPLLVLTEIDFHDREELRHTGVFEMKATVRFVPEQNLF